jgi:hypothetical protein
MKLIIEIKNLKIIIKNKSVDKSEINIKINRKILIFLGGKK